MTEKVHKYRGKITSMNPLSKDVSDEFGVAFNPEDPNLRGLLVPVKYDFGSQYQLAKISAA